MKVLRVSVASVVACSSFAAWLPPASAQVVVTRPFPMEVVADRGFTEGVELRLRSDELAAIDALGAIVFTDVFLPGGRFVDLELRPARFDSSAMNIYRDGDLLGDASIVPEHSSWSGRVRGEEGSSVFLSFSSHGSRGWIHTQGRTIHMLAKPDDESGSTSRLIEEAALAALGVRARHACGTDVSGDAPPAPAREGAGGGRTPLALQPPRECTMAIETDFQLYEGFGDESAEILYVTQLLEAASEQYVEQIYTYFKVIYLGIHTHQNPALPNPDRWDFPDLAGASARDLLDEFVTDWEQVQLHFGLTPNPQNKRPAAAEGATLNHLLSGVDLGGGAAAGTPGICNRPSNYAVSTGIGRVLNPFPVEPGALNHDFIVFAHQVGHGFGSLDTHDFCPPIDTCAVGTCNAVAQCAPGTIMSSCHLCPGGIANVLPYFHERCVAVMRAKAVSCLPIHVEGAPYCAGDGLDPLVTVACPCGNFGEAGHGCSNSNAALGGAMLSAWGGVEPNTIVFTVTGVPNDTLCAFVRGTVNVPSGASFGDGIRCYSGTTLRFGQQRAGRDGNAENTAQAPAVTQVSGATRYYQVQYRNLSPGFCTEALFNASNGWKLAW